MTSFQDLALRPEVLKGVEKLGFVEPSEIQKKAIPALLCGDSDLVGLAQTGTGKTAAFGLPLASLVDFDKKHVQAVVVCPTRELCLQITKDLISFTRFIPGAGITAVYGGASIEGQLRELKKGTQIVVATPGRLLDFIQRKSVNLEHIAYAVFDEADEMLNMGFKEDIDKILENTPADKRTWLFSATMPKEVATIARRYMKDPVEVTVGEKNTSAQNIEHHYFVIDGRNRYAALKRLLDFYPDIFGLVFCRTRMETKDVADKLMRDGYNADALHGDLSQQQRDSVMAKFRDKTLQILVATDVAARGLDVDKISHVIHYQLPDEVENYTHRSGRTARAGNKGISLALVGTRDVSKIRQIEKILKTEFVHSLVPSAEDVCLNQVISLAKKIKDVKVNNSEIQPYMDMILQEFEGMDREEIISNIISIEFNRFLDYYRNAPDLNRQPASGKRERDGERSGSGKYDRSSDSERFTRLFVSIGKLDDVRKGDFLRFVCDNTGITSRQVGRIDIMREFTFIDVEKEAAARVISGLKRQNYNGRPVRAQKAEGSQRGSRGNSSAPKGRGAKNPRRR